mmetsp:Transcript_41234/g.114808  ORF Transcript_41234/g.114808 Transcript_41234/m.114808 type:complete len:286 (+) Transcript_41234:124-981(+)
MAAIIGPSLVKRAQPADHPSAAAARRRASRYPSVEYEVVTSYASTIAVHVNPLFKPSLAQVRGGKAGRNTTSCSISKVVNAQEPQAPNVLLQYAHHRATVVPSSQRDRVEAGLWVAHRGRRIRAVCQQHAHGLHGALGSGQAQRGQTTVRSPRRHLVHASVVADELAHHSSLVVARRDHRGRETAALARGYDLVRVRTMLEQQCQHARHGSDVPRRRPQVAASAAALLPWAVHTVPGAVLALVVTRAAIAVCIVNVAISVLVIVIGCRSCKQVLSIQVLAPLAVE